MKEKVNLGPAKKWLELSKYAFETATLHITEEQKRLLREELLDHFRKVLEKEVKKK